MSKDKQGRPIHKHTMFFFAGDVERIRDFYPTVPPSKVIRHMLRNTIERLEQGREDGTQLLSLEDDGSSDTDAG